MTNDYVVWLQLTRTYNDEILMFIMNLYSMWLTIYPGCQEMHTTTDLDYLLLRFKILHRIE